MANLDMEGLWAACRALVGCECRRRVRGKLVHRRACGLGWRRTRPRKGWTAEARHLAGVYGRIGGETVWRGVGKDARSARMRAIAKVGRAKLTPERRAGVRARVAELRRRQHAGEAPISGVQARLLHDWGMWRGQGGGGG